MGPLHGLKVIEIVGIGPGPFAAMMLADMGAEVIRIDRADRVGKDGDAAAFDFLARSRPSLGVDLKRAEGIATVLRLVERSDALLEGFRPGVMERLGLGPDVCLKHNPRLVYGRMTGWGQQGPRAQQAGHDIDYIAIAGALHAMGRAGEAPIAPLNLVGDFGGGGLLLAFGMLCALRQVDVWGSGQVVDAAMIDGAALLMTMAHGMRATGFHLDERGVNLLDSGAHFYETYETADRKHMAVGAIEPQFYAELLRRLELEPASLPPQFERTSWPAMKQRFAEIFRRKTRAEWTRIFDGSDACVAPVLSMGEATQDEHVRARQTFVEVGSTLQPAPAPRFSRTPPGVPRSPVRAGANSDEVLARWGFGSDEIATLRRAGAVA
ncbi:MAG TPA: CaiB/BaiF CoA-transferase family protein [Polyangiales bacterium]|jgi:alpha-methylacyl-CoA racemase|nr:CaiB/BaiF CoA-transferase family protein [Polyangiales bacterium]